MNCPLNHLSRQIEGKRTAPGSRCWPVVLAGLILLGSGTAQSNIPVTVDTSGLLAGKTVIHTAVGRLHNLALCSDGTLVAWIGNAFGQLGNNSTTSSSVPVSLDTAGLAAGEVYNRLFSGPVASYNFGLVAKPSSP